MGERVVLKENEFWIIKTFGPRYFTATSKVDGGEHRIYYSKDSLERDFGSIPSQPLKKDSE